MSHATSAHRLTAIPAEAEDYWRLDLPGSTALESAAGHHGSCPFRAVTDG